MALCEAVIRRGACHRISELKAVEVFVAFAFGAVVPTPENLASLANGLPFRFWMHPYKLDERNAGLTWRHGNAFRPWADDLRRKLHRLRRDDSDDRRWFEAMVTVSQIFLDGAIEKLEEAQLLAESVGEREPFEQSMRQELIARSGCAPASKPA